MRLSGWELIAILVLVLLLFGGRKLPELAGSLGKSLRIFRRELTDAAQEDTDAQGEESGTAPRTAGGAGAGTASRTADAGPRDRPEAPDGPGGAPRPDPGPGARPGGGAG